MKAIIGTGIGLATLLLVLIGLMFQQNANVNARIDDVPNALPTGILPALVGKNPSAPPQGSASRLEGHRQDVSAGPETGIAPTVDSIYF